jgi:hypothetical protein
MGSQGGGRFLTSEVPLQTLNLNAGFRSSGSSSQWATGGPPSRTTWCAGTALLTRQTRLGVDFFGNGNRGSLLVTVTEPPLVTAGQAH